MSAREYFNDVKRASQDVEQCQRVIAELTDGLPPKAPSTGGRSEVSDPTFSAMVTRDAMLADVRARADADCELIGEALVYISGLRWLFSKMADVLELYYIDCMSWEDVAHELHIGESTARRWRNEACEEADKLPISYVMGLATMEKP